MGEFASRTHVGDFDYTKQAVHDILNEVDPKYVPPVGSLCVGPPPAPVHTPLLRAMAVTSVEPMGSTMSLRMSQDPRFPSQGEDRFFSLA